MDQGAGTAAMNNTITLASINRTEAEEEDENRLQNVSSENPGKKEAEEILAIHIKLISERQAALTQLTNILKETTMIKQDLEDGTLPSSTVISEQVKQLLRFKENAVLCLDTIMASVCMLGQAIKVFKEKRGTAEYHPDCDSYATKANHLDESCRLERRRMYKLVDETLKTVKDAKEKEEAT